jgi:hypothetical protein
VNALTGVAKQQWYFREQKQHVGRTKRDTIQLVRSIKSYAKSTVSAYASSQVQSEFHSISVNSQHSCDMIDLFIFDELTGQKEFIRGLIQNVDGVGVGNDRL